MPHRRIFHATNPWNSLRPHVLVVACSDGRLQAPTDEFLRESLGIGSYDRLYLPGGPGALSEAGAEFSRASRSATELQFLLEAHQIEEVLLMYHGPAPGGPDLAVCADYRRVYGTYSVEQIRKQQETDTERILRGPLKNFPHENVRAYRLEVAADESLDVLNLL